MDDDSFFGLSLCDPDDFRAIEITSVLPLPEGAQSDEDVHSSGSGGLPSI